MIRPYFKLLTLWLLAACSAGPAEETSQERNDISSGPKIAYNVSMKDAVNTNVDVWIMNMDGSEQRNLTDHVAFDVVFHSANGKIYFASDRHECDFCLYLYEMDADGGDVRKVTDRRIEDSWISSRKNGTELAVVMHFTVDSAINIIDLNGNVIERVNTGLPFVRNPSFSPDGGQIVFRGSPIPLEQEGLDKDEIYIINVDGTGLTKLTEYPYPEDQLRLDQFRAGPPKWEPNHNLISFNSDQRGNMLLFTMKPDGSDLKLITPEGYHQGWHSWSPDGEMIAFNGSGPGNPFGDIYIMNTDGTDITRLTKSKLDERGPIFVNVQ